MLKFLFIIAGLSGSSVLLAQYNNASLQTSHSIDYQTTSKGFVTPPTDSRLRCYWWWLNSMTTKETITRDLEEMKSHGYGGASIVDAGSSNYAVAVKTKAGAFVAADIPSGTWICGRDTSGATTKMYYNNAGTLLSVALI